MTNLDSILKSRDIILPTRAHLVKATIFPVVMYRCESWTIKKVECQRIDAFELWCWRRLLRVLWPVRRSNQSMLKEINSDYLLKRLVLKLKFQCFGHLMQRTDLLEKALLVRKAMRSWASRRIYAIFSFPVNIYSIFFQDLRPLSVNSTLKSISRKSCLI